MLKKPVAETQDARNIKHGREIPKEGYCDQPYIVVMPDGSWLCTMTTSRGEEGAGDQHIVSTVSRDQGRTWSRLLDIEPSGPPEASWVTPLLTPGGRVYAFYTYNADNRRSVVGEHGVTIERVDTLGDFVFKYSDNGGRSWSADRYTIPVREFAIDRNNPYRGEVRFFWSVSKPILHEGSVYIGLAKVGIFSNGDFMESSEGVFLRSDNLLAEHDPAEIRWETLPDGDIGLRAPLGPIADEHNLTSLSDGSLYCTYRTVEGHNCHAYSRDGGRTWTPPEYAAYLPGGRRIKHPRAANFVRRCANGRYILWFHHHGGRSYADRNPVWLAGGVERDGYMLWSQPEIVLYDDDPTVRISYPDFIEADGRFYIAETQKTTARVHEIDRTLLEGMWRQMEAGNGAPAAADGREVSDRNSAYSPIVRLEAGDCRAGARISLPEMRPIREGGGFALELWVRFDTLTAGQVLADTRDCRGIGMVVATTDRETVSIALCDGRTQTAWDCDEGLLRKAAVHHLAIIVDGGPKLITFVVDGQLNDGGERQFGWGRLPLDFRHFQGGGGEGSILTMAPSLRGELLRMRVHDRYLRSAEAVFSFRESLASPAPDEPWRAYMKLGINHHLLYPETFESEEAHKRTLPSVLNSPYFEAVDMFVKYGEDARLLDYEAELVRQSGKEVVYNGPLMIAGGLNPHDPDAARRKLRLEEMKRHADRARRLGASKLVVASGPDPGTAFRSEQTAFFVDYLAAICRYAPELDILIEPFDRSIGKNLLIGPTEEALAVVRSLQRQGVANIGLLVDMGHVPLMGESFAHAVGMAGPCIKHVHLGSCVMDDPADPLYGDMHPPWGYPGGANDVPELVVFLQCLADAGYLGPGRRPTVTFEMRPCPGMTEEESILAFVGKLNQAWPEVRIGD